MSFERTVIDRDIRYNQNITNLAVVHGLVDHFISVLLILMSMICQT